MANLQQAKKAIRVSERKRVFNDRRRRTMRRAVKEIEELVADKKAGEAQEKLPKVYKAIDKAAKQNVIKKNTAARMKSRMARTIKNGK